MTKLRDFFNDDYDRETLLVPSMAVVLVPIIVAAILGFNVSVVLGFLVLGVEVISLLLWLMASSVRDAGRKLEATLFTSGMPTTDSLRLRSGTGFERKTRRDMIEKIVNIKLLDRRQELLKPDEADERIVSAVNAAKEKMRDQVEFKLLRRELKSYGQWRNLVAIRWWGVFTSSLSLTFSIIVMYSSSAASTQLPLIAMLVSLLGCMYWFFIARNERVTTAAQRYSDQFFKSLTLLDKR